MSSYRQALSRTFEIAGRDYSRAGNVSLEIKDILKEVGIDPGVVRRAAIAAYEAEMNVVMYALRGKMILGLDSDAIRISVDDEGPGIEDIELAMQEGYSTATDTMREMGFGAGMGLPNIKRNADAFDLTSTIGRGTSYTIVFYLEPESRT